MTRQTPPPTMQFKAASDLLKLSHEELDALIKEAEQTMIKAHSRVCLLAGIKIEKTLREGGKS